MLCNYVFVAGIRNLYMRGAGFSTYPIYTIGKKIVKYRQKEKPERRFQYVYFNACSTSSDPSGTGHQAHRAILLTNSH